MKRIAIARLALVIGVGVTIQDAEAKRMGEGKTSGVSRGWAIAGIQQC
jgi:hypothetical protein